MHTSLLSFEAKESRGPALAAATHNIMIFLVLSRKRLSRPAWLVSKKSSFSTRGKSPLVLDPLMSARSGSVIEFEDNAGISTGVLQSLFTFTKEPILRSSNSMDDHPTVSDQPEARQQLGVIQGETAYRVGDGPGQSNSDPGVVRRPASPPSPMQCESSDEQTTLRPTSKRPDTIIRTSQIPKTTGERSKTRLRLNHDLIEAGFGW